MSIITRTKSSSYENNQVFFFFQYSSAACSSPSPSSPPLAAETFWCRSSSELLLGPELLFPVGCQLQSSDPVPIPKASWLSLLPHYRIFLHWLKREILLNVSLPTFFFLYNRAIILIDHHNYAEQALRVCSGKKPSSDREDSHRDNTEQTSKANERAAWQTTTLLLGCWNLHSKRTQCKVKEKIFKPYRLQITKQVRKFMCKYEAFLQRSMSNTSKYLEMLL